MLPFWMKDRHPCWTHNEDTFKLATFWLSVSKANSSTNFKLFLVHTFSWAKDQRRTKGRLVYGAKDFPFGLSP